MRCSRHSETPVIKPSAGLRRGGGRRAAGRHRRRGRRRVHRNLEALDVLVNAAGVIRLQRHYDPSEFVRVVDINLTGTMRMAVACRAALAKARGAIVNIASMHAIFGAPLSPAYAASKAGVVQLTKSLAVAWAEDGIRVNAIAPGSIETPMTVPARSDTARIARFSIGRRSAAGGRPMTSSVPRSSWPAMARASSPAPCSRSTAAIPQCRAVSPSAFCLLP